MPSCRTPSTPHLSRRHALLGGAAVLAAGLLPGRARAAGPGIDRWLELRNTHTGEELAIVYRAASGLVATAVEQLNWLLRDHRANVAHPIDAPLFDQLADLAAAAGVEPRFEIISGYRSPASNAQLADASSGVARHSLHMEGRAIDVRLRGVSCATLRDLALQAGRGGVGYYRRSDFVHLDTGRVRAWAG